MCPYTHIHTHAHLYTYIHYITIIIHKLHTYIQNYTCTHIYIYVCTCMHTHLHTYIPEERLVFCVFITITEYDNSFHLHHCRNIQEQDVCQEHNSIYYNWSCYFYSQWMIIIIIHYTGNMNWMKLKTAYHTYWLLRQIIGI